MSTTTLLNRHKDKEKIEWFRSIGKLHYIGRGSLYGNPFSHLLNTSAKFLVRDRHEAVQKYREWAPSQPTIMNNLEVLRGCGLECFCSPNECHGEVLLELLGEPLVRNPGTMLWEL